MLIGEILNQLKGVKKLSSGEFIACCPSHDDKHPSLNLKQTEGRILMKCKAGCSTEDIVEKLGLKMSDLFTNPEKALPIVAEYNYLDENGDFLFQVVRFEPKSFRQRHKNGNGEWVWNLEGVRRVPYHLPEISKEMGTIYMVEGEKDADKLWEWGQVATTTPGGASNWKPEYANYFTGKRMVLTPDKDDAGFTYARTAARTLQGKAREIKCIILPNDVKDISDWIEKGGDVAELPLMEQDIATLLNPTLPHYEIDNDAIIWQKNMKGQYMVFRADSVRQERTGIHGKISITFDFQPLAWSLFNVERSEDRVRLSNLAASNLKLEGYGKDELRQDLDKFCAGLWEFHLSRFTPELTRGDDNLPPPVFYLEPYLIEGGGTILFAPPGRGKSFTALLWAQSINCGINKMWQVQKAVVLYINLERSRNSLVRRLSYINEVLGLPCNQPMLMLHARGKSLSDIAPAIRKSCKDYDVKIIFLDSISRAGFGDLTENRPVNAIIDTLSGLCNSWMAIGHTPRSSDEHIYGGIHFDAGADIVVQLRSEVHENTLGIGYEIVKSNDLPAMGQKQVALEFEDYKLVNVRPPKPYEFPELESRTKTDILQEIEDYILNQDKADATATDIADSLCRNRSQISHVLNNSGKFVKTRKEGRLQYYGCYGIS